VTAPVAVLSLGSNLGDRLAMLRLGLSLLAPTVVSRVYETAPWGDVEQDDFLNVIALCPWDAAEAWRRDVDVVWASGADRDLVLPHPHAHERAFVLVPWLDVDPGAVLPGHGPVAGLQVDRSTVRLAAEQL
jgi:2-amino-4-hydroxy-6-hydroxymethyldihydropteridine diphosphokinase